MKTKQRITALLLAGLLLSAVGMTACAKNEDSKAPQDEASAADTTAAEPETLPRWKDSLPEGLNFDGTEIVIHARGNENTLREVDVAESSGEVLEEAIYNRNRAIEERLGVVIKSYAGAGWQDYTSEINKIRATVSAMDNAWQIIAGWSANITPLALENCFQPINDMEYIDLSAKWWNQAAAKGLNLGGVTYFGTGDISYESLLGCSFVAYCNDRIATDNNIPSIKDMVNAGSWTIDNMISITEGIYNDLDGNGQMDEKDQYGLALYLANSADAFYTSCDIHQVLLNSDGLPQFVPDQERFAEMIDKIYPIYYEGSTTGSYMHSSDNTQIANMFIGGQALFTFRELSESTNTFRDMEDSYTIYPMPKLNENQENYRVSCFNSATLWGIPTSNPNPEPAAAVLEAMAAESCYEVVPVYFENCLQSKYARNETTIEMLEIIRANGYVDAEYMYRDILGSTVFFVRDILGAKSNNVASWYASKEKVVNKLISETVKKLEELKSSAAGTP